MNQFTLNQKVKARNKIVGTKCPGFVDVPAGAIGVIVYVGDFAITVDWQNAALGKSSISKSICPELLEEI